MKPGSGDWYIKTPPAMTNKPYELPEALELKLKKAKRLEYYTLGFMVVIIFLIYLVMGNSQAMKTAWMEDMLSLIPPIAFLYADRIRNKTPNARFPYGYHRVVNICFMVSAVALTVMGAWLITDGVIKLIKMEHPTIGTVTLLGHTFWQGWLMIVALIISIIPPVILGRMKIPLAEALHDKVLYTDADMNKADWMTGLAAIAGIAGIAIGWYWADAAAAIFISFSILKDGFKNLKMAITELMDHAPRAVGTTEMDELAAEVHREVDGWDWVSESAVRIREHGHVYFGEVYIIPKDNPANLVDLLKEGFEKIVDMNWRLFDFTLMPVKELPENSTLPK
jgi:cation diffusion facilitator family transporter